MAGMAKLKILRTVNSFGALAFFVSFDALAAFSCSTIGSGSTLSVASSGMSRNREVGIDLVDARCILDVGETNG